MNNLKRYTLYILNAIDILSIILSYFVAYYFRVFYITETFYGQRTDYNYFLTVVLVAYFIVNFLLLYKDDKYLHRNSLNELTASMKMSVFVMVLVVLYFNFAKLSANYSRIFEAVYTVSLILVDFFLRVAVKKLLIGKRLLNFNTEKVLLIGTVSSAEEYAKRIEASLDWRYHIEKVFVTSKHFENKTMNDIPVVTKENLFAEETLNSIDGVIILPGGEDKETVTEWMNGFKNFGKSVHIQIPEYELNNSFRSLDNIGDMAVVTYRDLQPMSIRQQLFKRAFDILFSVILLPLYLVFFIIVKVFTSLESPGPILVKRVRMGKNSRRFYQYRFRTYRTDALQRVEEGKEPFTFIGRIINTLHIDGFPEILNVLAGDMSFVGPKAPNLPKYLRMSVRERNLLSVKPGIIGYWTGEQDPIKALNDETAYLENWNFVKDISVILYCILRYITLHSLRVHGDTHTDEEYVFVKQIREHYEPVSYDASLYYPKENILYSFIKRTIDILFSFFGIIILSPVFLIIAILIMANDGGAPFYTHERVGKNGKKIYLTKFRSMREDAGNLEELLTPDQLTQYRKEFKIDNDPRITPMGEFLRKSSLDELPQLFNILRGDMSIVGPRPILEGELFEHYTSEEIARLLSVRPGLTGYWQAYARNNAEYKDHKRQDMELTYIEKRSLFFDMRIFFKTIISVFTQEGAK